MTAVSMSSCLALYGEKISVLDFDHQGHAPKGCFDRSKYPLSNIERYKKRISLIEGILNKEFKKHGKILSRISGS